MSKVRSAATKIPKGTPRPIPTFALVLSPDWDFCGDGVVVAETGVGVEGVEKDGLLKGKIVVEGAVFDWEIDDVEDVVRDVIEDRLVELVAAMMKVEDDEVE